MVEILKENPKTCVEHLQKVVFVLVLQLHGGGSELHQAGGPEPAPQHSQGPQQIRH
jgi:hypothetical protein